MLSTPSPSRSIQRNQYSTLETHNTRTLIQEPGGNVPTAIRCPDPPLPGVCPLVLLRDQEPDKVCVTEPPFFMHSPVSEGTTLNISSGTHTHTLQLFFQPVVTQTSALISSPCYCSWENSLDHLMGNGWKWKTIKTINIIKQQTHNLQRSLFSMVPDTCKPLPGCIFRLLFYY